MKTKYDLENIPAIEGPVLLVGDVHGVYGNDMGDALTTVVERLKFHGDVVFMGDVGLGFPNDPKGESSVGMLGDIAENFGLRIWLIRGNHDNPSVWKAAVDGTLTVPENVHFLQQGYCRICDKLAYILPGGLSIDLLGRTENYDWWRDEGVSPIGMSEDIPKVELLLSHVGPKPPLLRPLPPALPQGIHDLADAEQDILDKVALMLRPTDWVYAHYHYDCPWFLYVPCNDPDLTIRCKALDIAEVLDLTAKSTVNTESENE